MTIRSDVRAARRGAIARSVAAVLALSVACARGPADQPPAPALEDVENLEIANVFDAPVSLRDGVYEGQPAAEGGAVRPRLEFVKGSFRTADLDGDGVAEAVAVLVESSGGSGVFNHLVVAARRGGKVENVATAALGDRVMIRSYRVEPGAVALEVVERGPDDPACCPTQRVKKTLTLDGGRLATRSDTLGALSIVQLTGTRWQLVEFRSGVPVDDDVTTTAVVEDGRLTGLAGCNRYVATLAPAEGNALAIRPVVATRTACEEPAMSAETRYLRALEHVNQFGFVLGRLALTYQDGDDLGTLLFDETTK